MTDRPLTAVRLYSPEGAHLLDAEFESREGPPPDAIWVGGRVFVFHVRAGQYREAVMVEASPTEALGAAGIEQEPQPAEPIVQTAVPVDPNAPAPPLTPAEERAALKRH